jgi:hypothetical protein
MAFTEFEEQVNQRAIADFMAKRRPPEHIRPRLDIGVEENGQAIEIFSVSMPMSTAAFLASFILRPVSALSHPSYGLSAGTAMPNPFVKGTSRKRAAPYVER